jgi:hypothetical protein
METIGKESEYIGFIEGYAFTTNIDKHGDRLSPEAIENIAQQMLANPSLRTVNYNHDRNQPMGYITDFHIENKGELKVLRVKVGIYKTRPDLWEKIQSGEISGFSYGAKIVKMESEKMPDIKCSFTVELDDGDWHRLDDMLTSMGVKPEINVKKSIDVPTTIMLTISILSLPGVIYGIYDLWKKFYKNKKGLWIKIKTTKRRYNFKDNTIDEIIEEIELESKR